MYPLAGGSRFSKGSKGIYMVKSPEIPWELVTSKKAWRMALTEALTVLSLGMQKCF